MVEIVYLDLSTRLDTSAYIFYYYTKSFAQRLKIGLRDGQAFKPPWLMSGLIEAVIFY